MPFTAADADKHKKGLSEGQKKTWAKIANAVFEDCMEVKKSDKECAPSAIRVANSKVG
jgi:hypothetical protein